MQKIAKPILMLLLCCACSFGYAQNSNWLLGTWEGTATINNAQLIRTLVIESVDGAGFSGTRSSEVKGKQKVSIKTALSGNIENQYLNIKNGAVLYKKIPANADWIDCSGCGSDNKVSIENNRIVLTFKVIDCKRECNGTSVYSKSMCDFDSTMQQYLVSRFGNASDIKNFKPCIEKTPEQIAEEKKRQQEIADSINLAKKRKQQIADSTVAANNIAKQKEQQRIKDSVTNDELLAKKRQKEIADSIDLAKKHMQQIADSTVAANNIAKQKEQQRLKDSVTNAELLAKKRQKEIADSIDLANKRKQQIEDSTTAANNLAKQKEQQRIKDSIASAELLAKNRLKDVADSINLAKKRQQQIADSTAAANKIAKQREKQRLKDSVANAGLLAKKRQKEIADSISIAKKRQQEMEDSTVAANNLAKQKEQQRIKDSLAADLAKKNEPPVKDAAKASTAKAFETRGNVLLNNYQISTPDILIELFDNAQIDGDRVSVYHNNELIVSNKTLLKEPIIIKIHADATNRTHEFTMIAENLGTIAPNTALMRVTVGDKVYKLSVKTDLQTNAKIVFYYDGN